MIKSKAIISEKEESDGLRICVTTRIHDEFDFDIWWKDLAPQRELMEAYAVNKTIAWEDFRAAYERELEPKMAQIEALVKLAQELEREGRDVTLLCYEPSYHQCQREVIREKCLARDEKIWPEE
ncbi:DUF488 domain-containing protein [Microgenomates group bacterium]|nr:DUF488 domain-containing protein [Microgenomates group bacterium]